MKTRTRNLKRLLSLALCLCMVTGLLPATALAADAPAITTESLAEATVGEEYTAQLAATASDRNGALTWEATDLPDWLTLTDNGGGTATLDGKPTETGDFSVTVTVTETIPAAEPEEPAEGTEPDQGTDPEQEPAPAESSVLTASKEYTLTVVEAMPVDVPDSGPGVSLLSIAGKQELSFNLYLQPESGETIGQEDKITQFSIADELFMTVDGYPGNNPTKIALISGKMDVAALSETNLNDNALFLSVGEIVNGVQNGTMNAVSGVSRQLVADHFRTVDSAGSVPVAANEISTLNNGEEYRFLVWDGAEGGNQTVYYSSETYTYTADNAIPMTVTKDGQPVTGFSNTDTIVITATLTGTLTNPVEVMSVWFDNTPVYLDKVDVLTFGSQVTITLRGLYQAEYDSTIGQEIKSDPLPPGNYQIHFWDDGNHSTEYISTATYTVTPGGVEPGGEQGIYGADAFFTTQRDNNDTERILSGQPYSLYLYTNQPLTGTETATATVYYTPSGGGGQRSFEVTLKGTANGYVLSGRGTLDNDVTGTVNKVTFQLGNDEKEVDIGKDVISTVQVTFEGYAGDGVAKYLKVYNNGSETPMESVYLGTKATPDSTYVTAASNATFKVTGTQNGREVEYAETSTVSGNAVTLTLANKELKKVTPSVQAGYSKLFSYQYTLKWYKEQDATEPIATGSSYYLLPGETVYVQATPVGTLLLSEYQTSNREQVSNSDTTPTIKLNALAKNNISGKVTLTGSNNTSLSGVKITVTNTVNGSAVSKSTTTGTDGSFAFNMPVLEGAVLTASRGDLGPATQELTAGQDHINIAITLAVRQGVITLPQRNLFASCTLTTQDGDPVAFTTSGDKQYIYLTDPNAVANQILKMHLDTTNNTNYTDFQVDLDGNGCATVPLSAIHWTKRGGIFFTLSNPGRQICYALLYDRDGTLLDVEKRSILASTDTRLWYCSPYLAAGSYTYLFMVKNTWQAISDVQDSLEKTKAALTPDLYLEKAFTITNNSWLSDEGTLPSKSKGTDLELEASGLSVTAENDVISVRMTVAPKDGAGHNALQISLFTNQTSSTNEKQPDVLNGSLYINGKRSGSEVYIDPNDEIMEFNFDGIYRIKIPDVDKYGGWPVTLQWQSYRTNLDRVEALAHASLDWGDTYHYVGETTLYEPAITLYAPEAVADSSFYVYGSAPANSTVTLFVDGVETAQLKVNKYGLYNVQLSLDNPIGPGYHTVSAKAVTSDGATATSNVMDVRYNASLPVLTKIELTDRYSKFITVWDSETGTIPYNHNYYYYMPNTPMKYRLTFDNGSAKSSDLKEVTVYLPRADGVEKLKATYQSNGQWVTGDYLCGNNPPTGAWVYYVPNEPAAQLTDGEYEALKEAVAAEKNDKVATDQQNEVNGKLTNAGLNNVTWTDGKPTEGTLTFTNGSNTYNFKITRSETTETSKTFPTMPKGTELTDQMNKGFTFMNTGDNTQYTRMGTVDGKFTVETVSKYQAGSNDIWKHEIMTMNKYVQVVYDASSKTVSTTTYENTATDEGQIKEPDSDPNNTLTDTYTKNGTTYYNLKTEADNRYKTQQVLDVWQAFYAAMDDAEQKLENGTASSNTLTRSMTQRSGTGDDGFTPTGPPPEPPSGPPIGVDPDMAYMSILLQILEQNGVDDMNKELFWTANANRETLGGGLYNNLKWKVGEKQLEMVKDYLKNATDATKAAGKSTEELAKWAMKQLGDGIWNQITNTLGFGKSKEMRELTKKAYDALREAEKNGQKIDWTGFPFNDECPDPREKQDPDKDKDNDGGGGSGGSEEPGGGGEEPGGGDEPGGDEPGGEEPGGEEPGGGDEPGGGGEEPGGGGEEPGSEGPQEPGISEPVPDRPKPVIDPSGYVYEAVENNRLEGVSASVYEVNKTTGERTLWDASVADQVNPQTTGEDGYYEWFVPEGGWSVTVSKEGYEAYTTGKDDGSGATQADDGSTWYMPVPPVQLDVNIGLTSLAAPEVESLTAATDGVYIAFSQYMKVASLTNNVFTLKANGKDVPFTVECATEYAPDGTTALTRSVILRPTSGALNLGDTVVVNVDSTAENYAGKTLRASRFTQALSVVATPQAAKPTATVGSGKVAANTSVELKTGTDDARIFYTTDGSDPSTSSKLYTGPILIAATTTIKAIAVKAGMKNSEIATFTYTVKTSGDNGGGTVTPQPPVNPGGSSGGGGSSSYSISVPDSSSIRGGSISVSPRRADKGDTVTITVKPDDGYELNTLTVTDAKGNELEVTDKGSGKYTFSMPGSSVKIQVSFKEIAEQVTNPFADVYESDYYYDAVLWAVANGVTNGTSATTFSPNAPVTRAQMVTFLWRAYGSPKATGSNPFADVSADAYYYDAVLWAVANGVTNGTSATTFSPDAPVTRAQAVTFQWRAAGSPVVAGDSFDDVAADAYYAGAVTWAVANGITNGTGGNKFSPEVTVTRAQAVTFLWRELA